MEHLKTLYNDSCTLTSLFLEGVRNNPTLPAVRFDDGYQSAEMSYSSLNEESDNIAKSLSHLYLENEMIALSARMNGSVISVMLGILKIPAAFAFIDFKSSLHSNLSFIRELGAGFALVDQNEIKVIRDLVKVNEICKIPCTLATVVLFEIHGIERKKYNFGNWNLACAMQTSGTTGTRKTVKVPHRCIVPNIIHLKELYEVRPGDVVYFAAPFVFDPCIVGGFIALSCGACILLMPDIIKLMTYKFISHLTERNKVSILQCTPSFMKKFSSEQLRTTLFSATSPLRILELGGEPCPSRSSLYSWKASNNKTKFYNVYGLTEVSCWATIHSIDFDNIDDENKEEIPLGKVLLGTSVEVMDSKKQILKVGEGELFIGGRERICFIDGEDLSTNISWRTTGDVVRLESDGNIYFVRRIDDQIKRNGVKIFLKQIENAALLMPGIEECFSVFQEEKQHIILVVIIRADFRKKACDVAKTDLKNHLKRHLPTSFQPDVIMFWDSIPLTANGKLDKQEIFRLAYDMNDTGINNDISRSINNKMHHFWKINLGMNVPLKATDNFILCGGDSFQVVHIVNEVELWLKIKCPRLAEKLLNEDFQSVCSYLNNLATAVPVDTDITYANSSVVELSIANSHLGEPLSSTDNSPSVIIPRGHAVKGLTLRDIQCQNGLSDIKVDVFWEYNTNKCVDASPLIINTHEGKVVIIGSHSHSFYALWLKNGFKKWEFKAGDRIESSACASECGQKVFVGSYDGFLYCLDTIRGELLWKFCADAMIKCSPAFDPINNFVYFGSYNHKVYALCANSGHCIWENKPAAGSIFSSPCISLSPHHLYICTLDGYMLALNPNSGDIIWKYKFSSPVFSSCTLFEGGLCTGCVDNKFLAFDHLGNLMWTLSTNGPIFSSPCSVLMTSNVKICPFVVVGSHDHYVYCVNALSGSLHWKSQLNSPVYSSPFIHHLKSNKSEGNSFEKNVVYTCTTRGTLYILCLNCGKIHLEYDLPNHVFSSPVAVENYVVFGCRNNNIMCFKVTL